MRIEKKPLAVFYSTHHPGEWTGLFRERVDGREVGEVRITAPPEHLLHYLGKNMRPRRALGYEDLDPSEECYVEKSRRRETIMNREKLHFFFYHRPWTVKEIDDV